VLLGPRRGRLGRDGGSGLIGVGFLLRSRGGGGGGGEVGTTAADAAAGDSFARGTNAAAAAAAAARTNLHLENIMKQREGTISPSEMTDDFGPPQLLLLLLLLPRRLRSARALKQSRALARSSVSLHVCVCVRACVRACVRGGPIAPRRLLDGCARQPQPRGREGREAYFNDIDAVLGNFFIRPYRILLYNGRGHGPIPFTYSVLNLF
jgi:hypothetical protein